jgi:hypothetical protein
MRMLATLVIFKMILAVVLLDFALRLTEIAQPPGIITYSHFNAFVDYPTNQY